MEATVTIAIIQAILKYGPSAVQTIAAAMDSEELTVDKINSLFITKDPEEYFK